MSNLIIFTSGLIFAIGLGLSGMTDANKVIAFLNPLGGWDPSLAFVMVGAIGAHLTTRRLIIRREKPLFASVFETPTVQDVTPSLVIGAGLFGVGWALGGFCPGPGIVSATGLSSDALLFSGAMLTGMAIFNALGPRKTPQPSGNST